MGQYSSGETPETRETQQLTLDISIDREKYLYIHLKKSILEKLGIKEPGIYKLTIKLNGETYTTYIHIKKLKKQKLNLPTKYQGKTKATITNIEKYNLEKVIETIENFYRQGKIRFLLLKRDNKLYLKLDQFVIEIYSYRTRVYNNILRMEIDVQQGYDKIVTLQIRLLDSKIELYYKKAKNDYLKILDIKSARDIAVLEYHSRDYRRNPIMHLSLTSMDREQELSDLLKLLDVDKFPFIKKLKDINMYTKYTTLI